MSDFASVPEEALDRWLAARHQALVTDLSAVLDLEAGLREAMIPARHANLVAELRDILDVETGLSAIVSSALTTSPETEAVATNLRQFNRDLIALSPDERFAMRRYLAKARRFADDLDNILGRTQSAALARDFVPHAARDLDDALAHVEILALELVDVLSRAADLSHNVDLAGASDLAREIALIVADVRAEVGARNACDLADILADTWTHAHGLAGDLANLQHVHGLNDFTGVDMRKIHFAGVPLNGLLWSSMTLWPPDWIEKIKRVSVETTPGSHIYKIGDGVIF